LLAHTALLITGLGYAFVGEQVSFTEVILTTIAGLLQQVLLKMSKDWSCRLR